MPLSILVPMVVIGIGGIALLLHLLGLTGGRPLANEAAARAAWMREFPDEPVRAVTVSETGRAALIETDATRGIVWAMGADTVARSLDGAEAIARGRALCIDLPDYGARHLRLRLTEGEAEVWARKIGAGETWAI